MGAGSIIGWLIVISLAIALMNYPVKLFYRIWISNMPARSTVRKGYQKIQKIIVQNHRFFALFATLMMITHVIVQLSTRWLSWTGVAAAGLMVANGFLGGFGHFIRQKKRSAWFYIHRTVAVLLLAGIIVHLVTNGR